MWTEPVGGIPNHREGHKYLPAGYKGGRLTLTAGTAVTTADVSAALVLYYVACPWMSNEIAFPSSTSDGGRWYTQKFFTPRMSLGTVAADTNYDVFAKPGSNDIHLYYGPAWTSATARAVDLSYVDAVPVDSMDKRNIYLGTIRGTALGQVDDSAAKRFVWNVQNRVPRFMKAVDTTNTWTYTTATFRQANANAANQLDYVAGLSVEPVFARVSAWCVNTVGADTSVAIGIDSTSVDSSIVRGWAANTQGQPQLSEYAGWPGIGRHYIVWLEQSAAVGTTTWRGDNGIAAVQSGIVGHTYA